ncbi:MAG: bifunctional hydroxymethylpyrimidine kinase/phosphomethylpyrimidine kinase [Alphaproteobacteria bacterium]|nr:bifunctional hydroxymethylpyrimidine kinase/phosphomethylpyrimidine kinase [Alphaproteobacteria bacterium]
MPETIGRVLIIAGSDSGGGAGIQGDIKTVTCLGGYASTAITALTAQNTMGVFGIHEVPDAFIAQQIELVLSDIGADCIKIGMLHKTSVIETIYNTLYRVPSTEYRVPLVLDTVMFAKGGAPLLQPDAVDALKKLLIPRALVITPNIPEAEHLTGLKIATVDDMKNAAQQLLSLGANAVLLKGGHATGDVVTDILLCDGEAVLLTSPRIDTPHTHGTGCTYASAIATGIAQGLALKEAVLRAHDYVMEAIRNAPGLGHGHGPLGHNHLLSVRRGE